MDSIVMSLIHPFAMLAATLAIRVNGFYPNIFLVFAVWTMWPRMVAAPVLYCLAACCSRKAREGRNPYLWTFKDNVIEESLLNVISLPFAFFFIINRNDSEQGWCANDQGYKHFWDSFYLIAAAGVSSLVLSLVLLGRLLVMKSKHFHWWDATRYEVVANPSMQMAGFNKYPPQVVVQMVGVDGYSTQMVDVDRRPTKAADVDKFWGWTLWIGAVNMLLAFSGQWLLWGSKSTLSTVPFPRHHGFPLSASGLWFSCSSILKFVV